ncbi:MAG: hypothetical protein NTV92_02990, partial [Candidatus Bipolaricaulota bacterium]|nr:hypothetical protein [Candidatus Bipolaricaulota bacterium]
IQQLGEQAQRDQTQPRLRSTALPHSSTVSHATSTPAAPAEPATHEPIFEELGQNLLKARGEAATTPEHYNELGVRKYDLPALLRRLRDHFRGPSTSNPKLVSYLAAGGIQGLRPLRYEKRVARNRFIFFVVILVLILLGTLLVFLPGRR